MAALVAVVTGVCLLPGCGGDNKPPTGPSPPTPQVLSITPSKGSTSGGTPVRITGGNFAAGATVSVGGAPASDVVVESASSITAKTGARSAGPADVVVTVSGRSGTLAGGFSYEAPSAPPVIASITARGTRTPNMPDLFADLNDELNVTATVTDPDTSPSLLLYEWAAEAGTFSGTGAAVKWKAPATALTPSTVRLTLVVVDGPNRVTGTVSVRLHDSVKEVGDMAREFLLDFSNSNNSPEFVVRNFSTGSRCGGERATEMAEIADNRKTYLITASTIGAAKVNFAFNFKPCAYQPKDGDACAVVPAAWTSTKKSTGATERVSGDDYVTAVYEQSKWLLCASYFDGKLLPVSPQFIR